MASNLFNLYQSDGTTLFEASNDLSFNAITTAQVDLVETITAPVKPLYYPNDVIEFVLTISNHNTTDAITNAVVKDNFDMTNIFKLVQYKGPTDTDFTTQADGNVSITVTIPVATDLTTPSVTTITIRGTIK